MPLDATGFAQPTGVAADPETLYRARREDAIAAVAGALSWRRRLDLRVFKARGLLLTTRACFLGWLAELGHDGWHWDGAMPRHFSAHAVAYRGGLSFLEAADYFGLRSTEMFSGGGGKGSFAAVADALRRAPVVVRG